MSILIRVIAQHNSGTAGFQLQCETCSWLGLQRNAKGCPYVLYVLVTAKSFRTGS